MEQKKTHTQMVRMTSDLHQLLRKESYERNVSISEIIRIAIVRFLNKYYQK